MKELGGKRPLTEEALAAQISALTAEQGKVIAEIAALEKPFKEVYGAMSPLEARLNALLNHKINLESQQAAIAKELADAADQILTLRRQRYANAETEVRRLRVTGTQRRLNTASEILETSANPAVLGTARVLRAVGKNDSFIAQTIDAGSLDKLIIRERKGDGKKRDERCEISLLDDRNYEVVYHPRASTPPEVGIVLDDLKREIPQGLIIGDSFSILPSFGLRIDTSDNLPTMATPFIQGPFIHGKVVPHSDSSLEPIYKRMGQILSSGDISLPFGNAQIKRATE